MIEEVHQEPVERDETATADAVAVSDPGPDTGQPDEHQDPPAGQHDEHDGEQGEEPTVVLETRAAPCRDDYAGPQWTREALVDEVLRLQGFAAHLDEQTDRLGQWLLTYLPDEVTPERGDVDAVSIAIRVMQQMVRDPNGRLEPAVREAIAGLDHLPVTGAEDIRGRVEVIRAHLVRAMTAPPRPGGGEAPVYESGDITMVRFDRDRFRVELDLASETIAQMYAAATGTTDGPRRGVVEDLADVRSRLQAAEQALIVALAGRGASTKVPEQGSLAYVAWKDLIQTVVRGMGDSRMMPIAGGRP